MVKIEQPGADLYELVPYPDLSHSKSYVDRLAAVARVLGMEPPPVERCRVLEVGCASGGNLLPMAYGLPGSHFVGLDYSRRQIEAGREAVAAVGLANMELRQADILDLPDDLGQFDYIIAHGVYSWVPAPVRDALLAACRSHLAPQGVVYLSLNVYPGWHLMSIVRDIMFFSSRNTDDPFEKARIGRETTLFLAEALAESDHPFGVFLSRYAESVLKGAKGTDKGGDAFLLHDELSEVNDPVYFHDFARHIESHGLQYMAEAEFGEVSAGRLSEAAAEWLRRTATSLVEVEQYMDFLHHRTFRQPLLCHREVEIQRLLKPALVQQFQLSARLKMGTAEPDLASNQVAQFVGLDGATFTTDHPLTKAAFYQLMRATPGALDFNSLVQAAAATLNVPPGTDLSEDVQVLCSKLLKAYAYSSSLVNLHTHMPEYATALSERPQASRVALYQARSGHVVTNMRHERVDLDETTLRVMGQLDGRHSRDDVLAWLISQHEQGMFSLPPEHEEAGDIESVLAAALDRSLRSLVDAALLIA
jgi:methyltransferase-like protein/2-polyprenyl-3-methyl-5-hydroxy-6-metoxy-1,4-benzoquinol methylase